MQTQRQRVLRAPRFSLFPPVLIALIGANLVVFALGEIQVRFEGYAVPLGDVLTLYGGLFPIGSELFRPWQFLTSIFLHADIGHIFFNMLALWMFGVELANIWGTRRFLAFYVLCGLGAGFLHSGIAMLLHNTAPAIGASGAVMGVIVAFSMLFPKRMIFIFPFPPMQARFAALVFVGLDLYMGATRASDHVAHFAHLGGAIAGFLLILLARNNARRKAARSINDSGLQVITRAAAPREETAPPQSTRMADVAAADVSTSDMSVADPRHRDGDTTLSRATPRMQFGDDQQLIDTLLDKALRAGYNNLTPEEKELLNSASRRMK